MHIEIESSLDGHQSASNYKGSPDHTTQAAVCLMWVQRRHGFSYFWDSGLSLNQGGNFLPSDDYFMASVDDFTDPCLIWCRQMSPFTKTTVTIGNGCHTCWQQQGLWMNGLEAAECSTGTKGRAEDGRFAIAWTELLIWASFKWPVIFGFKATFSDISKLG